MNLRYQRRLATRNLGRTGIKTHTNISKGGISQTFSKNGINFNTRRGFSINFGKLLGGAFKGLSIR